MDFRKRTIISLLLIVVCLMPIFMVGPRAENAKTNKVMFYHGGQWKTLDATNPYLVADQVQSTDPGEGNYQAYLDVSTGTLTLNNLVVSGIITDSNPPSDLTIKLIGENKVTGNNGIKHNSGGNLTITADNPASLLVSFTIDSNFVVSGILVKSNSGATVTLEGEADLGIDITNGNRGYVYGINSDGPFTIKDNANLDIKLKSVFQSSNIRMAGVHSRTGPINVNTSGEINMDLSDMAGDMEGQAYIASYGFSTEENSNIIIEKAGILYINWFNSERLAGGVYYNSVVDINEDEYIIAEGISFVNCVWVGSDKGIKNMEWTSDNKLVFDPFPEAESYKAILHDENGDEIYGYYHHDFEISENTVTFDPGGILTQYGYLGTHSYLISIDAFYGVLAVSDRTFAPIKSFTLGKMESPKNLVWEGSIAKWDKVGEDGTYYMFNLFKEGESENLTSVGSIYNSYDFSGTINDNGPGSYYFSVQTGEERGLYLKASDEVTSPVKSFGIDYDYNITIENDGNGSASADKVMAKAGEEVTLEASPNEGYLFKEWQLVSGSVIIVDNKFIMVEDDVTLRAIFEEEIVEPTYSYTFISNQTSSFEHGSNKDIEIVFDGDIDKLGRVLFEGQELDSDNYTLTSGSIIIKIKNAFLSALANGEYTLGLEFDSDTYEARIIVSGAGVDTTDEPPIPETADSNTIIGIFLVLGLAFSFAYARRRTYTL